MIGPVKSSEPANVGAIALLVVVVAAAQEQERAGDLCCVPLLSMLQGPAVLRVRPVGADDLLVEPDVLVDAVHGRGALDVVEDRLAVGDGLALGPRTEAETQRVHVGVGTDARVAEQVPGAAHGRALFQDGVALGRAAVLQVPGRAHAGDAGAHDDDVKVLSHESHAINTRVECVNELSKFSTPCKVAAVTTVARPAPSRGRRSARPSGDDREQAILATAERLLEERSFADISVDDLAKGAGHLAADVLLLFPVQGGGAADAAGAGDQRAPTPSSTARCSGLPADPRRVWRNGIKAFFTAFGSHRAVARAAIEALATSPELRAVWSSFMQKWIDQTAAMIERRTGARRRTGDHARRRTSRRR